MTKTVADIAALVQGEVRGGADKVLKGVAPLSLAGPEDLSFLVSSKFADALSATRAGAVLVPKKMPVEAPITLIKVADPRLAMAQAAWAFLTPEIHPAGSHPRAVVDESAQVDPTARVYPLAYVGPKAVIGPETIVHPLAFIGPEVKIGARCVIHPQAVLMKGVSLGHGCIIHPGVVIGADGFGYAQRPDGRHLKVPQQGSVVINDEVEIGANSTVDRATFDTTAIGSGVKIDNLVQVAHNVKLGPNTILVAQVGISGSSMIGANCVLGGKVGVADNIKIGDRVMIVGGSGVVTDIPSDSIVAGTPARGRMTNLRIWQTLPELPKLVRRVKELERRLAEMEARLNQEKKG